MAHPTRLNWGQRAGFREVVRWRYRETASPHSEIVELDDRARERLFVEATR